MPISLFVNFIKNDSVAYVLIGALLVFGGYIFGEANGMVSAFEIIHQYEQENGPILND